MKQLLIILIALLLIAGCTTEESAPEPCNGLEIPREFGSGCCSDLNFNGICDDLEKVEEQEESVPEEQEDIVEEPEVEVPEEPKEEPEVQLSFTEEAAATFWSSTKNMNYVMDTSEYGDIWVWIEPGIEKYITVEDLWENNYNVLSKSQFHYIQTHEAIINGIEDRNLPLLNYLERDPETGQITGCFVEGRYLSIPNCIDDYPNGNPVIHYNPQFTVPENPLDWLAMFNGQEPSKINEDRTYKITYGGSRQVTVDEVFFITDKGSTKLYMHEKYRIPLQVDFLDQEGKVTESLVFEGADFNTPLYNGAIKLDEEEFS